MESSDEYLTPAATGQLIHKSEARLQRMRMDGSGPPFIRTGHRSVLYRRSDVDAWMLARRHDSTIKERTDSVEQRQLYHIHLVSTCLNCGHETETVHTAAPKSDDAPSPMALLQQDKRFTVIEDGKTTIARGFVESCNRCPEAAAPAVKGAA